jgi:hypothetical protein
MKESNSSTQRAPYDALRDPALWAWLIVALLAMIPARAALHVILS